MTTDQMKRPVIPSCGDNLTVSVAAARLGWSYSTTLRYFVLVDGVIIKPGLKKRGRTKRKISIPEPIFTREYEKLTSRISSVDAADDKMRELRSAQHVKFAA